MSTTDAAATMASGAGDNAAAAAPAAPAAAPAAQQRAPLLFRAYDVVERVDKPGELGLVWRVAGESESEFDDDDDYSDETDSEEYSDSDDYYYTSDEEEEDEDDEDEEEEAEEGGTGHGARAPPPQQQQGQPPAAGGPHAAANQHHHHNHNHPQHGRGRGGRGLADDTAEVAWLPWGGNGGGGGAGRRNAFLESVFGGGANGAAAAPALPPPLQPFFAGFDGSFASAAAVEPDEPTVEPLSAIRVVDRGLIAGDVVARSREPLGMTGVVLRVERLVDVEVARATLLPAVSTGLSPAAAAAAMAAASPAAAAAVAAACKLETRLVRGAPSTLLAPALRFCPDQHVIHRQRGWLGRIAHVDEVLTLRFADGVVAEVRPREPGGKPLDDAGVLLPTTKADAALSDGHRCPFYPGQVVDARSAAALRSEARLRIVPLPGSNAGGGRGGGGGATAGQQVRALRATVLKVEADELEVDWIAPLPAMASTAPGSDGEEGDGGRRAGGSAGGGGGARGLFARLVGGVRGGSGRGGGNDSDDDDDGYDSSGLPRSMRAPPDVVRPRSCEPVDRHFFDPAYWHLGTRGLWLGDWEEEKAGGEGGEGGSSLRQQQKNRKKKKAKRSNKKEEEEEEEGEEPTAAAAAGAGAADADAAASDGEEEDPAAAAADAAAPGGLGLVAAVRSAVASMLPSTSAEPAPAGAVEAPPSATAAAGAAPAAAPHQQQQAPRRAAAGRSGRRARATGPGPRSSAAASSSRASAASSGRSALPPLPLTALVVRTETRAVVAWQDGTISDERVGGGGCDEGTENSDRGSIPASRLLPVTHLDDHDFWPDDFVIERLDDDESESDDEEAEGTEETKKKKKEKRVARSGVVLSSDPRARTARVVFWPASLLSSSAPPRPLPAVSDEDAAERAETVPVYSIRPHRDFAFANGDVVVRLGASGAAAAAAAAAAAQAATQEGTRARGTAIRVDIEVPEGEGDDERGEGGGEGDRGTGSAEAAATTSTSSPPAPPPLPSPPLGSIGEVVGLRRGRVRVSWVRVGGVIVGGGRNAAPSSSSSGAAASVFPSPFETLEPPNELFVLSRDDDDDPIDDDDDYSDDYEDHAAAAGATAAAATGGGEASSESDEEDDDSSDEKEEEKEEEGKREEAAKAAAAPPPTAPAPAPATAAAAAGTEEPKAGGLPPPSSFPRFEVLEGEPPSDHIYLREGLSSSSTAGEGGSSAAAAAAPPPPRKWSKAVLKEWERLRAGLEEGGGGGGGEGDNKKDDDADGKAPSSSSSSAPTIWLRAWESRLDLLRCAIAGPPGTPYHDHLFLFDLCLPRDYPNSPPKVSYHAFGLRVNPNLYDNGKVCLSLLGTWAGRQGSSEVWDPQRSTLLQVLVSIQGLVLVREPYYNEAGYEKRVGSAEGAKGSRLYSESAFLLSCRSALRLLKRPPAPFGELVRSFYAHHRARLFKSCEAYLRNEVAVAGDEEVKEGEGEGASSEAATATATATAATNAAGDTNEEDKTSEGFRLALEQLFPRLRAGLDSIE